MIESPWLTVPECAVYLKKSEQAIRGLLKRGIIPPKQLGRSVYVDRRKLDEQIERSGDGRRLRKVQ